MQHMVLVSPEELENLIVNAITKAALTQTGPVETKSLLNKDEAHQLLWEQGYRIAKRYLYQLSTTGVIPGTKILGRWTYNRQELLDWVGKQSKYNRRDEAVEAVAESARRKIMNQ